MKKLLIGFACLLAATASHAVYNANMAGELLGVQVYADGDYIYLRLKNQPTAHPGCNPTYFVIPETVPPERRRMMLVRLLVAHAMKEVVNIGFDNSGDCAHGYIRVHEAG